jgi:uncharacterized protein YoxC
MMEQQMSIALQVALIAGSGALVVMAVVVVLAWMSVKKQLDRVVMAVEHVEAEFIPLARETRVVVDRLRVFSERTAGAVDGLLLPFRKVNTAFSVVQTGVASFLRSFWSARRPQSSYRQTAHKDTLS